jgi:hypothetical protein
MMNNETEKYVGELNSLREKVEVYETMLHAIQISSEVTGDSPAITHMIDIINSWSYAHRQGNGELTEKEQLALVRYQFERLKNKEWRESGWNSKVETTYKQKNRATFWDNHTERNK